MNFLFEHFLPGSGMVKARLFINCSVTSSSPDEHWQMFFWDLQKTGVCSLMCSEDQTFMVKHQLDDLKLQQRYTHTHLSVIQMIKPSLIAMFSLVSPFCKQRCLILNTFSIIASKSGNLVTKSRCYTSPFHHPNPQSSRENAHCEGTMAYEFWFIVVLKGLYTYCYAERVVVISYLRFTEAM